MAAHYGSVRVELYIMRNRFRHLFILSHLRTDFKMLVLVWISKEISVSEERGGGFLIQ